MLDINLFRVEKGGDPEVVRESQRKRGASVEKVDEVIALDLQWRQARFAADTKNKAMNNVQKQITVLMKSGKKESQEVEVLFAEKTVLAQEKIDLENEAGVIEVRLTIDDLTYKATLNKVLSSMGNIVHESVRVGMDERDNEVVGGWWPNGRTEETERARRAELLNGDGKGIAGLFSHHEVLTKIAGYDQNRGTNVAGHRGYFLMDSGVDFNLALVRYGLDFLARREYTKLQTPFFMRKEVMAKTAQLEEFDEALYKINEKDGAEDDENSKYMIATSEQPISAFHMNEWFVDPDTELPKKYAGYSTCFRKEAGSHGKETWGIFRVHQFEKVEQFIITDTDKSWQMHEEMMRVSEDFYKSLGLPYRVISIVSGALNNAAAKKYDLEAWFPFQAEYKELVSCSNCTDYQSRRLDIRVGPKKNEGSKKFAHCLNGTLCATERTLCCILENYQTVDGVTVPDVLQPYMNNQKFIPFVKDTKTKKSASSESINSVKE